jgi:hypothetical protein
LKTILILHDSAHYNLRARGHLFETIFSIFPHIFAYFSTNLSYIPVVIPISAHPIVNRYTLALEWDASVVYFCSEN